MEPKSKDPFLQLMFFKASEPPDHAAALPASPGTADSYTPVPHFLPHPGIRYALPLPNAASPVRLDSPAVEVMTDLRRVSAVTIGRRASVVAANQLMIERAVRALFVVDDNRLLLGIITSTDILGERPIQVAYARGLRHDEVAVNDAMTPADRLEVMFFSDVLKARVGDVVTTLRMAGRQHALAVEVAEGATQQTIRGIFSLTQIARQLGITPQPVHDIARTFAEIEAIAAA